MKAFLFTLVATMIVANITFSNGHPYASASQKANADMLRQLEAEFMKAAAEHGSQGYLSYYADDAVEVPNGVPIIQGKVNIAKAWASSIKKTIT
jgi:ketosteroid isomerase-like protein